MAAEGIRCRPVSLLWPEGPARRRLSQRTGAIGGGPHDDVCGGAVEFGGAGDLHLYRVPSRETPALDREMVQRRGCDDSLRLGLAEGGAGAPFVCSRLGGVDRGVDPTR